jgi:recombination protein RecA
MAKAEQTPEQQMSELLAGLDRQFGKGTLMRLGDDTDPEPVEVVSTGSITLDEAMRVGGFALGRIVEIYGPESSGKTSLALTAMGNAQRTGKRVAIVDAEHALDPAWAETLGVNTADLYVSQPDNGEQALQVTRALVASGLFAIVTVDSVAALVPEAELKGEIGDTHVALQARMMSQALRVLTGTAHDSGTTVIFINQLRDKVGVFFGSSETQPGGKALKFYATIRLDVRRIQTLKDGERAVGSRVRVKVVKNKLGRPFGTAEFDFLFDIGISRESELLDLGVERKVLKKSGAFYAYQGESLGQGKAAARAFLAAHPEVAADIEAGIRRADPALPARAAAKGDGIVMEGDAPWDDGQSSSDT